MSFVEIVPFAEGLYWMFHCYNPYDQLACDMNSNCSDHSFTKEIITLIEELELYPAPVHIRITLHRHLHSLACPCQTYWESHRGGAKAAQDVTHITVRDTEIAFKKYPRRRIEDSIKANVEDEACLCGIKPDSVQQ